MAYTNSPLVNHTRISPNQSGSRNHAIDTISIHCVVGQCSVETLGVLFSDSDRYASSNYGIGYDGRIGLYVPESNRSWCTSSAANDNRAITIEVASDTYHPYAVNDKAYNALIRLLVDICQRNKIERLLWKGNPNLIGQPDKQNMTVHRWFDDKSCPGDWLYSRHGAIAEAVNKKLEEDNDMTDEQVRKITREEIAKSNPEYKTVAAVPAYWRDGIQELVDMGVLQGGGKGNLELKRSEAKAMVVCLRMLQLFVGKQYATFDELPEWAKPYIQRLIDRGTLDGVEVKEDGTRVLNLNTIMIRLAKMLADEPIGKTE